jgi:hypothetical protein
VNPSDPRARTGADPQGKPIVTQPARKPSGPMELAHPPVRRDASEMKGVWVTILSRKINSIAVIPADAGFPVHPFAQDLALLGLNRGERISALDAQHASVTEGRRVVEEMAGLVAGGSRVVVSVGPLRDSEAALPVALSADAVIVVVNLGVTTLSLLEATVDAIGRDRVLGCVAVRGA